MAGKLVISLDLELMWGVRDHRSIQNYGDAVLGGRQAISDLLRRFSANNIRATWAAVGLLFARNRDEMMDFSPDQKPTYHDKRLSPYDFIRSGVGLNEKEDPLHFGRSLIDQIAGTPGQELATHSYSHYYCLEPGQTVDQFSADIASALNIAKESGHNIRSIVFPRNQMGPKHIKCCKNHGIDNFRGNPNSFLYRPMSGSDNGKIVRGFRLLDSILPVSRNLSYQSLPVLEGANDVRASRFLRPYNSRFPLYSKLHQHRIKSEMEYAAKSGSVYHLWWHPHNMGRDIPSSMEQIDVLVSKFIQLRDDYGMESVAMSDLSATQLS